MVSSVPVRLMILSLTALALLQGTISAQSGSTSSQPLPETPAPQPVLQDTRIAASNVWRQTPLTPEQASVVSLEGMHATLSVISEISSRLPSGSAFQARIEREVAVNGQTILPKGTLIEGRLQTIHARRLMRPGSLFMEFERVILPGGAVQPVNASLASTESNAVKSDAEGMLHPTLSKKRMLIQFGGASLAAKLGDDLAQVIAGSAVSASTARYAGMAAAGTFLVIQKGREVKLRPGDRLEVEFGRVPE